MKRVVVLGGLWLLLLGTSGESRATLTLLNQFNPANESDICGLAFDPTASNVWLYGCSAADVQRYSTAGAFLSSVPRPGESANDVDVEIAPVAFTLESTTIPKGGLLFINGETGVADIYAVDKVTGSINETLNTSFGISHVVGGAYHRSRSTFFLVQDNVPGTADENRVAEIDPVTGSVLNTFQTTATFSVSFGDIEVCHSTGNLLVVSSVESTLAEYKPGGAFVAAHALPVGVSSLSGIGVDDVAGEIWVGSTGGLVSRLGGDVCPAKVPAVPALHGFGLVGLVLLLFGSTYALLLRRGSAGA